MTRATLAGFSLVELLVVITILGTTTTVASLAIASALRPREPAGTWETELADAQARAVETGEAVVVVPDSAHLNPPVLFLPDGRALGPAVDPLTGSWKGL